MQAADHITGLVGPIGRISGFPTVDELNHFADGLAAAYPEGVSITELGRSRGGDPIRAVRVGTGRRHILVFGNPHPNEPIGMATIRHLLGRMAVDDAATAGATWHFLLCVDPDGTRLNEGWFAGPHTRTGVARGFYRPPAAEQPEWCFPTVWRGRSVGIPLQETEAMMALIDRTRPALIASLHNAEFGGGFFYTSGGEPEYWSALTDRLAAADVPIYHGEPDAPGARTLAQGVFELPLFGSMADLLAAQGLDAVTALGGGGCRDYTARYGTAILVCELPLWVDERIGDGSAGDRVLGDLLDATAADYRALAEVASEVLARVADRLSGRSPFERSVRALVAGLPGLAVSRQAAPQRNRIATRGEIFVGQYDWTAMLRLRLGGMLLRLLDDEYRRDRAPALAAERDRFAAVFDQWCADVEQNAPGVAVPLERLVRIQAESIMLAATRLRDGRAI
ncbi:M14 family zinc carboxypeptidase [Nocardia sp. NBC_00508]|uniref:M14 family zinc carboxypeptidase n=1 Tax=Nocardia sp. NBC_00508 TaxID=2975992 RepID=UPI002E814EB8|nr:M14 family zinc carboxypeptidase [Nocardia sp. NBC_00508]WUD66966.1 M14 family zinc carboxypeptidase [Nocardia sp. NBC_00508]